LIYVGNVTGRALRTEEAISEDLATNIAHGVRWYDATAVLTELGCRLFLEMPPGHVLTELGREAFSGVRALAVGETSFTHALLVAAKGKLQKPTYIYKDERLPCFWAELGTFGRDAGIK
jgi:malonate decarboxylase epsilon subunit